MEEKISKTGEQLFGRFGRLGTRANIDTALSEAKGAYGEDFASIKDKQAGTVAAYYLKDTLFRAICKGGDSWIIVYNSKYYSKE